MFYSAYISEKLKSPFQTNIIHPTCREAAKYYLGDFFRQAKEYLVFLNSTALYLAF